MDEQNTDQYFEDLDTEILKLLTNNGIISICRVGSSLKKCNCKDIDYFIICSKKTDIKQHLRNKFLNSIIAIDDSYRFTLQGFTCDLALYEMTEFENKIENIVNMKNFGEQREWATGYWLPEGFILDLMQSKILYDEKNFIGSVISEQKQQYNQFRLNMIKRIKIHIKFALSNFSKIEQFKAISYSNLILALLRLYNLSYNRGIISFKKILNDTKKSELSEEFSRLFSGNISNNKLQKDVDKIIERCGEKVNE